MTIRYAGEALDPEQAVSLEEGVTQKQTIPNGKNWWKQNAAIPGNTWIMPRMSLRQAQERGEAEWYYPFFRLDLVDAGLLPASPPPGAPKELQLPPGVSVFDAIRTGLIR